MKIGIRSYVQLDIFLLELASSSKTLVTPVMDVMFSSVFVRLFVRWQDYGKLLNRFSQNLVERWHTGHEKTIS